MTGKVIIVSAPSGAGKTSIVKHVLQYLPELSFSTSATTRTMREGEINGKDYYFLSVEDFKKGICRDVFLEWEEVYANQFYGTLKSEIQRIWDEGKTVIFDVDVKGGAELHLAQRERAYDRDRGATASFVISSIVGPSPPDVTMISLLSRAFFKTEQRRL